MGIATLSRPRTPKNETPGQTIIREGVERARQSEHGVYVTLTAVTPELAGDFLATNFENNRNIAEGRVTEYARQMLSGDWTIAEACICFDSRGRLVNGQHRCTSAIQAGATFLSVLLFGIDQQAILNLDSGYKRTNAQSLGVAGIANGPDLAALAEYIYRWSNRTDDNIAWQRMSLSKIAREDLVRAREKEMREACSWGMKVYRRTTANKSVGALCWLLFNEKAPKQEVEAFFSGLSEGENLERGNPILLLSRRLLNKESRSGSWKQVAITIKAWNMWRSGKTGSVLHWREDEGWPEPI